MKHTPAYHIGKLLNQLSPGDAVYVQQNQHEATMLASRAMVKVRTETVLVIENYKAEPRTGRLTKITVT